MPAPLTVLPPEPLPGDRVVITAPAEPPADAQLTVRWQLPHGIATEAVMPARGTQWELATLLPDLCAAAGCPGGNWSVAIDAAGGPWAEVSFRIAVPIEPAAPGDLVIDAKLGRKVAHAALRNASSRPIWIPAGEDLVVSCATEVEVKGGIGASLGVSLGSVGPSRILTEEAGLVLEPGMVFELSFDPGPLRKVRSLSITVEPAGEYHPIGAAAPRVYLRDPVTATVER